MTQRAWFITGGVRRPATIIICAGLIILAGCSVLNDPGDLIEEAAVTLPSAGQISLDLPNSLAPPPEPGAIPNAQTGQPPCDGEDYPGAAFACVIRFMFARISTNFDGMMCGLLADIAEGLKEKNIPKDVTISFSHDGFEVKARWDKDGDTMRYDVGFYDPESGDQVGHWDWSILPDGGANGVFKVMPAVLNQAADETTSYGLLFVFESNHDGSEKTIDMDLDFGDTPPDGESSPVSLRLSAEKSEGMWRVSYGMYFPTWLSEDLPAGIPTVILVKAAGGVEGGSPSVMSIVTFGADDTTVPADAEENNSICDYVTPLMELAGVVPPGHVLCGDNNPYYLGSDGSIQEAGPVPDGFENFAAALPGVGFVITNPTLLRDLKISF